MKSLLTRRWIQIQVQFPASLTIVNTIEDFKSSDKNAVLRSSPEGGAEAKAIGCKILSFVDLKKDKVVVWPAFPARGDVYDVVSELEYGPAENGELDSAFGR